MIATGAHESPYNVLVGLEIHQQLASITKLFCSCPLVKSEQYPFSFERRLRPAQSELGRIDPAAVFEFSKGKSNLYLWNPESSCLVEADEEPPHDPNEGALESVLVVASMLRSRLVDEIHVMRKIVIDGSNTSGFQRTMVVGLGGSMKVAGEEVGVQSITLEEDAARILGEDASSRRFALDRLGVPLVEVALDPVQGSPEFVGQVALHLGRVLRSTGRVARGLGTIRQDLNVSVMGGKVVEVKGVQKLNLVPRVVEYESERQIALIKVAEKLKERRVKVRCAVADVTVALKGTQSGVIKGQMAKGGVVLCVRATGLQGLLGWELFPGVRLGREIAEIARVNSLGGVVHSDEFERQGVAKAEEDSLRRAVGAEAEDALVLIAGSGEAASRVAATVALRLEAASEGVPAETRAATDEGETRYMRPRPGSQRMYPETDIPVVVIGRERVEKLRRALPEDWEERVGRYSREYSLSRELALKVYDSDMGETFEELSGSMKLEPSVVAGMLTELPVRMAREGVPDRVLSVHNIAEVLRAIDSGRVAKEAAPEIFRALGAKAEMSVDGAIESLGLKASDEFEILKTIDEAIAKDAKLVEEKGEAAFSPVMGEVMRQLRGRADGAAVGALLKRRLAERTRRGQRSDN